MQYKKKKTLQTDAFEANTAGTYLLGLSFGNRGLYYPNKIDVRHSTYKYPIGKYSNQMRTLYDGKPLADKPLIRNRSPAGGSRIGVPLVAV